MKKFLAVFLSALMLFGPIVPASAQGEEKQMQLSLGSGFASVGNEVAITVEVSNNPGMAGMVMTPSYDTDALELVGFQNGKVFATQPQWGRNFVWSVGADSAKNGTLITLVFQVKDAATLGAEYPISVRVYECSDVSANAIEVAVVDGSVFVTEIPENAHAWGDWNETKAPTCTETGIDERECSGCHAKETRTTAATGHTDASAVVENKVDAACTVDGSYDSVIYCLVCEAELSREAKHIDKLGHDYSTEWTVDVEPTCTAEGSERRDCEACDHYETQAIAANGHTYDDDRDASCNKCGDVREIATEQTTTPETLSGSENLKSGCGATISGGLSMMLLFVGAILCSIRKKEKSNN